MANTVNGLGEFVVESLNAQALSNFGHGLKFHANGSADRWDVLGGGVDFLEFFTFEVRLPMMNDAVREAARRSVLRQGVAVELTGTEFDLLHLLAREPGKVFSRDDILNQLRGHEADLYTRAVDIVVSRLRKKLEPLDCIKTLRNAGYSLALRRVPS